MRRVSSSSSGDSSTLVAMSMASTLTARSLTPINNPPADDAVNLPASPLEETFGANTNASLNNLNYGGTVVERTSLSDASNDSSVEEMVWTWDKNPP